MFMNFACNYIILYGSLTRRKISRHGADGFTSPSKEVLRIFIALKISSSSAGFEPTNLWSSFKHDNHYTTENDDNSYYISIILD
jgi:hypothetical protein